MGFGSLWALDYVFLFKDQMAMNLVQMMGKETCKAIRLP